MINNIDVTLRDGGYQNGFSFPSNYAVKHAGLKPDQIDAVTRLHPLRMLDPRPSLNSTSG